MFRAPAFSCPDARECYCRLYGECGDDGVGLMGCSKERCGERWDWPPGRDWPQGWPEVGWKGEVRNEKVLEGLRREGRADVPKEEEKERR